MNEEQVKSALRSLISTFGGVVAGFFAAKGWATSDQVMTFLNSGALIGAAASLVVGIWGLFVHKQSNAVAVVNAIPAVSGVVTKNTPEGRDLAKAVPSKTVAPAGTPSAAIIAHAVPVSSSFAHSDGH